MVKIYFKAEKQQQQKSSSDIIKKKNRKFHAERKIFKCGPAIRKDYANCWKSKRLKF